MEIEAKYRVADGAAFESIGGLTALGRYRLEPQPEVERQVNTYFDTPERTLTRQRATLRLRQVGAHQIVSVKRSRPTRGALHIRDEWETELGELTHPHDWPPSQARTRALDLIGDAALFVLLRVRTRRRRAMVYHGARRVAEIALDTGAIMAGGRTIGFREVEIELAGGSCRDLRALVGELQRRVSIEPEPRGKKSRGLALMPQQPRSLGPALRPRLRG